MEKRRTKLELINEITKLTNEYKVSRLWAKTSEQLENIREKEITMRLMQVTEEEFRNFIEQFTEGLIIEKTRNSIYYHYNGEIIATEFHSDDVASYEEKNRYYIIRWR